MTHYDVRILEKLNVLWYPVDLTKEAWFVHGLRQEITNWCDDNLKSKWRYTWKGLEFNNKHDKMMFILRWGEYVL